jgi:hypothetical protein
VLVARAETLKALTYIATVSNATKQTVLVARAETLKALTYIATVSNVPKQTVLVARAETLKALIYIATVSNATKHVFYSVSEDRIITSSFKVRSSEIFISLCTKSAVLFA